jgi:hypothetical protein
MQTSIDSPHEEKPKRSPRSKALLLGLALAVLATLAALVLIVQDGRRAEALAAQDDGACAAPVLDAVADPLSLDAAGRPALNLRPDPASLLQTAPQLELITPCAPSP